MFLVPLIAVLFAGLALLTLGLGVEALIQARWGDLAAYLFIAMLCYYPAHLLFRANRRMEQELREGPPEREEQRSREQFASGILRYTIFGGTLAFAIAWLAGQRGVAIVGAVIYLFAAPLVVATRLEPPKSPR